VLQPWQDKMHLSQKGRRALFSVVTVGRIFPYMFQSVVAEWSMVPASPFRELQKAIGSILAQVFFFTWPTHSTPWPAHSIYLQLPIGQAWLAHQYSYFVNLASWLHMG